MSVWHMTKGQVKADLIGALFFFALARLRFDSLGGKAKASRSKTSASSPLFLAMFSLFVLSYSDSAACGVDEGFDFVALSFRARGVAEGFDFVTLSFPAGRVAEVFVSETLSWSVLVGNAQSARTSSARR